MVNGTAQPTFLEPVANLRYEDERKEAEQRYPFIKMFRDVKVVPSRVKNKGGLGEFLYPDDPTNPNPGDFAITVGEGSKNLQEGVSDTIVGDMVHAASEMDPGFQHLKQELSSRLSPAETSLAKRRYENDYKGKYSGSNFANFDNFLNNYWLDGMVQHLLLPENSEIGKIKKYNPDAVPVLEMIKSMFETEPHGF